MRLRSEIGLALPIVKVDPVQIAKKNHHDFFYAWNIHQQVQTI
jgi:hypothetical protein